MKTALIVAAVPHYFAARVRAAFANGKPALLINGGSSEAFYVTIRETDLDQCKVFDLPGPGPRDIFTQTLRVLSEHEPDRVVISGWATAESFAGLIWAKRYRKPLVVMSESQAIDAPRSLLREWIKSRVIRSCDAALVGGSRHREYLYELGMPDQSIFLGYNAVENSHFALGADRARGASEDERRRLKLPPRYLLASARFIPKKNLTRLIEAYGNAISELSEAPDLVILGDGPERQILENTIAQRGVLGRVHLLGVHPYNDLPSLYGLAEGFVHVSTAEQWGLVINEAAAAGLPLVVSKQCGATPELIQNDVNGWSVDAQDVESISTAVFRLITLSSDKRAAMGEASRDIVADWGPERFASGLMAACERAMSLPRRSLAPWDALLVQLIASRKIRAVA